MLQKHNTALLLVIRTDTTHQPLRFERRFLIDRPPHDLAAMYTYNQISVWTCDKCDATFEPDKDCYPCSEGHACLECAAAVDNIWKCCICADEYVPGEMTCIPMGSQVSRADIGEQAVRRYGSGRMGYRAMYVRIGNPVVCSTDRT
jgi:hypothetical protein